MGTHFIVYTPAEGYVGCCIPGEGAAGEGFFAAGVMSQPLSSDLVGEVATLNGVEDVSPYISFRAYNSEKNRYFIFGGFDPAHLVSVNATACSLRDLVTGSFLKEDDRDVVMLNKNYADMENLSIGDTVEIYGQEFNIIGIVNPKIRPARADIYMHISDAAELVESKVPPSFLFSDIPYNVILVEVASATAQNDVIAEIREIDDSVYIYSFGCYVPASRVMNVNEQTLWFITIVVFAAIVLFSMRTQMASVLERKHDIGILKAIGWPNKVIVGQILFESLAQALIGGFLGCLLALLVVTFVPLHLIVGQTYLASVNIPASLIPLGILLSAVGGIVAGIIPALNAAKKYPAEALRHV
jgi:putative ABC transport system permease protein